MGKESGQHLLLGLAVALLLSPGMANEVRPQSEEPCQGKASLALLLPPPPLSSLPFQISAFTRCGQSGPQPQSSHLIGAMGLQDDAGGTICPARLLVDRGRRECLLFPWRRVLGGQEVPLQGRRRGV